MATSTDELETKMTTNQVAERFTVGDEVSYCFNGDCYPDGTVARITKSRKYLYTSTGGKYVREVRSMRTKIGEHDYADVPTECYTTIGGTWALVKGVFNERNPHF